MREPKWLVLARGELGVREAPGPSNNPQVVSYYQESVGKKQADMVPWCAAFVGAMLVRSGKKSSGSLMARSYLNYGKALAAPKVGCIVVFTRGKAPAGHVAFVTDIGSRYITVIGGNQADAVTIATYPTNRVLGYRWP